ncbi:MAG: HDOD domain-containing protein [Dehalococcoidia bacterium]|nr:HDOD domain-containing protein [Dehalococcoidia bacterium]MCA9850671.1 HDOD domain-containing protein [Dehalococcoidia bacterium]MCA9857013.1 HDOD domain-containing protein [Dehalococcoidia bacterium]MCB9491948.1 HDOD domain-containing protein [Dehalococcoidia bacterium]
MHEELSLPVLPAGRMRAFRLLSNPSPQLDEIVDVADADVGLLAALLRAANSAASAPMSPIGTARNATVRIGTEEARRIILATAANETFRSARRSGLNLHDVWGHLFATAVIADHLALASVEHSEAFSAGLLHDLGRLAMAANQSDRFRSVIGAVRRGADPRAAERELFGVDHVEWGVEVAQAWHFPESVVQGIAGHHEGAQGGIGWIVRRAREVSLILGLGDGVREADETEVSTEARMLPVISELGGPAEMHRQITWYRGALVV